MGRAPKVIFLVDMNAFFIGCEALGDPSLRVKPAAVAGDPKRRSGIILTANYAARRFGVQTTMTIYQAQKLCPGLVLIPPHRELYQKKSHEVMALFGEFTPVVEQNSIDEAWLDMTGTEALWGIPPEAARKIMGRINGELGLWCSIGISENKFLAKMAADLKKPQGITELWERDVPLKLWPLPVSDLYGIGRQTAFKLRDMGLHTIGDLAAADGASLRARFGKFGREIHRLANGLDDSPVVSHEKGAMKSVGRSTTLPQDITDLHSAREQMAELAEEVGTDLRRHGKKGSTVQITLKYADFRTITRQKKVTPTNLTRQILAAAWELLGQNWTSRPVRLLGVSVSGFERTAEEGQLSLFGEQGGGREEKEEKLEKAVDSIRGRFGNGSVRRASALGREEPDLSPPTTNSPPAHQKQPYGE